MPRLVADPELISLRAELKALEAAWISYTAPLAWAQAEAGIAPGESERAWMEHNQRQRQDLHGRIQARIESLRALGLQPEPEPVIEPASPAALPKPGPGQSSPPVPEIDLAALEAAVVLPTLSGWQSLKLRRVRLDQSRAIASLPVPRAWQALETETPRRGWLHEFGPEATPGPKMTACHSGKQLPVEDAAAFQALLASPPGPVDLHQHDVLILVLRDVSDEHWFYLHQLCTADLSGRRVLLASGCWRVNAMHALALFVATGTDRRQVEELHYTASAAEFQDWLPQVQRCFAGVGWSPA